MFQQLLVSNITAKWNASIQFGGPTCESPWLPCHSCLLLLLLLSLLVCERLANYYFFFRDSFALLLIILFVVLVCLCELIVPVQSTALPHFQHVRICHCCSSPLVSYFLSIILSCKLFVAFFSESLKPDPLWWGRTLCDVSQ